MANSMFPRLNDQELLTATRELARKSHCIEADLLELLGEVDERKLYLECARSSMFGFCVNELGFSEDVAYHRITVARAARQFPALIEAVRAGRAHVAGLRVLVPHLTSENHADLLAQAAGKSRREIEEMVAKLAPQPPVPTVIRKVPERRDPATELASSAPITPPPAPLFTEPTAAGVARPEARPVVAPLSEETFKVQFTASRGFRDKLRKAQDLMRHRAPDGDVAMVLEKALDLLIENVEKERFAVGRKARAAKKPDTADVQAAEPASRHIPDSIKRAVYERDGGRCAFVDPRGQRCDETGWLELDHEDGFAKTGRHDVARIRLLCRKHNQHAADQMYGRELMDRCRRSDLATRPGASSRPAGHRPLLS